MGAAVEPHRGHQIVAEETLGVAYPEQLWPVFYGSSDERTDGRVRVIEAINARDDRGQIWGNVVTLGVRVVLDRLSFETAVWQDDVEGFLERLGGATEPQLERWVENLDELVVDDSFTDPDADDG
jgi:hypothetical protein